MTFKLCRINKDKFDELLQLETGIFESMGEIIFDSIRDQYSQPVVVNGQYVDLDIDIDKYQKIVDEDVYGYTKFAKVGMELHKDLSSSSVVIPRNIFYEKEIWAYLSLTVFKNIVKALRLKDSDKVTPNKIKQFYFNAGEISRTGLMFLWVMVDRLDAEDDFEIVHTAFEFVDPVKAVLERTISKNPKILRAFVQGIINNGKNPLFKNNKYRSKVPSNISCYASVSMLESLEYDEMVEIITQQQKAVIS